MTKTTERKNTSDKNQRESYEEGKWLALWHSTFSTEKANIRKRVLVCWLKVNLPAIFVAVAFAAGFHYLPLHFFSKTPLFVSSYSLSILALGILSATAAILAILVAFLAFWFGNAKRRMESAQQMIKNESRNLDLIGQELARFRMEPDQNASEDLKRGLKNLARKTNTFDKAIMKLKSRFTRAQSGTYYDTADLVGLELSIDGTGGLWFKACATLTGIFFDRAVCRNTWINAMNSTKRLIELNDEVKRSRDQTNQIIDFMPTLISILFIFLGSLLIAFIATSVLASYSSLLANLILAFTLIILLSIHLVNMVRLIWKLVSSELATYEANRFVDTRYTARIEEGIVIDDKEAILDVARAYSKVQDNLKGTDPQ